VHVNFLDVPVLLSLEPVFLPPVWPQRRLRAYGGRWTLDSTRGVRMQEPTFPAPKITIPGCGNSSSSSVDLFFERVFFSGYYSSRSQTVSFFFFLLSLFFRHTQSTTFECDGLSSRSSDGQVSQFRVRISNQTSPLEEPPNPPEFRCLPHPSTFPAGQCPYVASAVTVGLRLFFFLGLFE